MTDAQDQVWRLQRAYATAIAARDAAEAAVTAARMMLEAVLAAHPHRTFRVFHPDDVAACFREDVTPWRL
jgi:hypothetical protein